MTKLIFYTTEGCHLCEQAASLLAFLHADTAVDIDIEEVDISSDERLVERYGIRIPVVKKLSTNTELGWPFDLQQLRDFV